MQNIKTYSQIGLLIFIYYVVYYLYVGLINPIPALGDSWDYHIPISQTILKGEFITLPYADRPHIYYPGASEAINSLLLLLHIPLTVSIIIAVIVLFFICFILGRTFHLPYYTAILFATVVCTLNVLVRWYNAVSIDVWLVIFFLLAIILLEAPKKTLKYVFSLGFLFGMLIGTKYSGWFFVLLLSIIYYKSLLSLVSIKRILVFIIPFTVFGLFWYIRNYLLIQNPFYPLSILGFEGKELFSDVVWHVSVQYPMHLLNALLSEYNIWILLIAIMIVFYAYRKLKHKPLPIYGLQKLLFIGITCLIFYTTFPASEQPWIMVSSLRYSFPAFIPLILCVFLLAAYFKKEPYLAFIALGNMLMVLSMAYYPKLTLVYISLAAGVWYFVSKFEPDEPKKLHRRTSKT